MQRIRPRIWKLSLVLLAFCSLSCSVNILEEFSDKTTDAALLVDAQKYIDEGSYQKAIDAFADMSTEFLATREVVSLRASAYGGLCGVNFLNLTEALQNMGASSLFELLLLNMKGATATELAACKTAESILQSGLPAVGSRTSDENIFAAIISLGKIGAILAADAGLDALETPDNGVVDATWGGCSPNTLTDTDLHELGWSVVLALQALGGQDVVPTVLPNLCSLPAPLDQLCSATGPDDFNSNAERAGLRGLIREGNDAVGFDLNSVTACLGSAPFDLTECSCN